MTTDPRVEAAAREMHRLEYGGAIDWDADGSLHSAFYLAAESILAAADAARVVPADVAGLVERLRETAARLRLLNVREVVEEAATALIALAKRAETAERHATEWADLAGRHGAEKDTMTKAAAAWKARAETAERELAVATEKIERAPAWGAPGGDEGPYTCTRCTQATWDDDDLCDACRGGDDA